MKLARRRTPAASSGLDGADINAYLANKISNEMSLAGSMRQARQARQAKRENRGDA